ncbi:MAG: hypothetical protein VB101_04040 [Rhodospirillaceae bacterium]|nr:hypothetical protein [Rhodospirillaceae bacterium]
MDVTSLNSVSVTALILAATTKDNGVRKSPYALSTSTGIDYNKLANEMKTPFRDRIMAGETLSVTDQAAARDEMQRQLTYRLLSINA